MGNQLTVVDTSPPEAIAAAIRTVNSTKSLRLKPGVEALWALYSAPGHALPRRVLAERFEVNLHFGWFCRRVAELLGANDPDALALVDYSESDNGDQVLTLKPSVVAALSASRNPNG